MLYKSDRFKLPGTTWDKELILFEGSYSLSNIQSFFK